jgi:quercetin dioxygenase-like cupin family protein
MKINSADSLKTFKTPNASVIPLATKRLGAQQVSVIRQLMESGHKNPTHTQTTEEVMIMLQGSVNVTVNGATQELFIGDTLIVPANTPHSIENASGKSAEWLIVSPLGMQFFGPDGNPVTPPWAE